MTEPVQQPGSQTASPELRGPACEDLRIEYQAAQNSAQHHDSLVWSVTSIMWGGSLVLMGFTLQAVGKAWLRGPVTALGLLGMVLITAVWFMAFQLNAIKRQKYRRCKAIEKHLHLEQHLTVTSSGMGRWLYGLIMVFFLAAWLCILWTAWHECS